MYQPCVTLQIIAEINMIVNNQMQLVDRSIIVPATEIQSGNFVVEHEYTMMIDIISIFLQFFGYFRNQRQILL